MIRFLKLQYQMGKIDEAYLDNLVAIGRITESEKAEIVGLIDQGGNK